jgi:hypothetical protein
MLFSLADKKILWPQKTTKIQAQRSYVWSAPMILRLGASCRSPEQQLSVPARTVMPPNSRNLASAGGWGYKPYR